ncbi:unnamed protein product [Echinostoma caproni]|uniref:DNA repair protein complementing XP-C cells n=1 Tax=Echinostoma caproni TaxID=27848 RepID=A0A183ANZ4_9TREM|nr:unnamed protein product [Echinostoma caproni]
MCSEVRTENEKSGTMTSEDPPKRKVTAHRKRSPVICSEVSDSDEELLPNQEQQSGSDDSYRPSRKKSNAGNKHLNERKHLTRSKRATDAKAESENNVVDLSTPSTTNHLEDSEGSETMEAVKSARVRRKNKSNLLLFSEFAHSSVPKAPVEKASPVGEQSNMDDSDDEDWEDVTEETVGEVDIMKTLLSVQSKLEPNDAEKNVSGAAVTVSVPLHPVSQKTSNKDPAIAAAQARIRQLKEYHLSMHVVHVLCYLAHSRSINLLCDSSTYRALGLSLLGNVTSIRAGKGMLLDPAEWTTDHLSSCLSLFLALKSTNSNDELQTHTTIYQRIFHGTCSTTDCAVLFVSALRVINFDVRVILALTPISLRPPISAQLNVIPEPKKQEGKQSTKAVPKINRKIISSDESDFEPTIQRRPHKSLTSEPDPPRYYVFAEVFLPMLNRWVCIDFYKPNGLVDKVPHYPSLFYVLGLTTTLSVNPDTQPYVGRNPVDLASRYDPDWCIRSRLHRLPADRWSTLLDYQRVYFTRDAALNSSLVLREDCASTVQRDRADEDNIRSGLLAQPLPEKMQDFKNHPLYILPRHLLKFEVIHPPDALPLGFFRGEPVYSRDCLHLCHTRESWLKEAKVVKPYEQPAKVVKARASLKRKLLQGSDPTPPMVEIFGSWQVEDYQPPVAQNGIVPRNAHGTIDLFKPCMLPIGCAHICLTGELLHCHYSCSQEAVPALIDAWRSTKMNAALAAAQERSERALDNWRRLVRGLFLWHRIKAQFALAPLHSDGPEAPQFKPARKRQTRKSKQLVHSKSTSKPDSSTLDSKGLDPVTVGSLVMNKPLSQDGGWQRLGSGEISQQLPIFPVALKAPFASSTNSKRQLRCQKAKPALTKQFKKSRRRKRRANTTSEEEESEPTPVTSDSEKKTESSTEDSDE